MIDHIGCKNGVTTKKLLHEAHGSVPHFDVFCNLLLHRPMATWNLNVLFNKKSEMLLMVTSAMHLIISKNQSKCVYNSACHLHISG